MNIIRNEEVEERKEKINKIKRNGRNNTHTPKKNFLIFHRKQIAKCVYVYIMY